MINFLITYWFEVLLFVMAAAPSIIIFSIKGRISHWFNKDLKKYEQQLDLLKMQKQLQFSNVYTNRAEIISKIYENVVKISMADSMLCSARFKDQDELDRELKSFASFIFESQIYFSTKGIYLSENLRTKLGRLHDQVAKELLSNISTASEFINEGQLTAILNAPDINKEEIFRELIVEFQEILGVIDK